MLRLISLCLLLLGCSGAGPGFRGIEPVTRNIADSRFVIRASGQIAEVIRTSPEMLPRFTATAHKAALAVAVETGCLPVWVLGDPALMLVGFACVGQTPPKMPKRKASFACDLWPIYASTDPKLTDLRLDCYKT